MVDQRQQIGRRHDLACARPGRFGAVCRRADQTAFLSVRADRGRQHAGDRNQRAVEPKLTERDIADQLVRGQHVHRHQEPERDGQIEVAALLLHVGRREIHRDPPRRQSQPEARERTTHPLPALGDRLVRQADNHESGEARADLHLHVDRQRLDTLEGDGIDMGDHSAFSAVAAPSFSPVPASPHHRPRPAVSPSVSSQR